MESMERRSIRLTRKGEEAAMQLVRIHHRLGTDAGSDRPHLIHFSGAQSLGGGIRAVAGLFHYLVDDSPLLFAQGASVQDVYKRQPVCWMPE